MRLSTLRPILLVMPLMVLGVSAGFSQSEPPTPKSLSELMEGEQVLPIGQAPLLNPICRFAEHPWFEITNLRPGRNLEDALQMNFACSGPLEGQFHIVVTTNGMRHHFPLDGNQLKKRRGVLTCRYSFLEDKSPFGSDIEAYIELTDDEPKTTSTTVRLGGYSSSSRGGYGRGGYSRGGFGRLPYSSYTYRRTEAQDPLFFKVSKSATRGKVPAVTFAREIRPGELRLYTARRKKNGPPPQPPEGYTLASLQTPPIAGTPVLAALEGDWLPAEVLSIPDNNMFVIHWPKLGHSDNAAVPADVIALSLETLKQLTASPESFSPSVVVPLGSLQPIPDGYIVPAESQTLLPGTPVMVYIATTAHAYTVTEDNGESVKLVNDSYSTIETDAKRKSITISRTTASDLEKPETKEIYAARLKRILENSLASRTARLVPMGKPAGYATDTRHYPISIAIPDGKVAVTADTPLKAGTKVFAFWGSRFYDAEVRQLREDGSVIIHWAGWSSEDALSRESLIIAKDVLEELKENNATTAEPTKDETSDGTFRLSLKNVGTQKIPVIKIIMQMTGLDLPTANEVVGNTPIDIKDGLSEKEAAEWRKKLETAGASIDVQPTNNK